ncbi:hypothetical protein [Brassicibacter mesophilus]|uniref:hypothetical protein n=1 Tax=Brassicibacter mesophilus TaxID=745119 RepID=UPI003D21AE06
MKRLIIFSFGLIVISLFATACSDNVKVVQSKSAVNQDIKKDDLGKKPSSNSIENNVEIKSITSFIPDGWQIAKAYGESEVVGDLNGDGINESTSPRILIIATGNKDMTYNLAVKAEKAILRKDEGGNMGEPFMGLEINRGSLLINHYGGSAWRWSKSYRFRYQKDGWYLIGASEDWFQAVSSAGRHYEDINLLTGDYIEIKTDDDGVENKTSGNRGIKNLINLVEFDTRGERQF